MNSTPADSNKTILLAKGRRAGVYRLRGSLGSLSLLLMLLAAVAVFVAGCGKKGPPKPPAYVPPPVVGDLAADVHDGMVTLSWTIAAQQNLPPSGRVAGFAIYRSKTSIAEASCLDCPVVYEKAGDVSLENAAGMQWSEPVESGYRYIYKVRVQTERDELGADSNNAEFIVP